MSTFINVKVTVDSDSQLKELEDLEGVYIDIYDERYKKGKKESLALKSKYAAQLNPFIEINVDGKYYATIYSEATEEPFKLLKKTIQDMSKILNTLSA